MRCKTLDISSKWLEIVPKPSMRLLREPTTFLSWHQHSRKRPRSVGRSTMFAAGGRQQTRLYLSAVQHRLEGRLNDHRKPVRHQRRERGSPADSFSGPIVERAWVDIQKSGVVANGQRLALSASELLVAKLMLSKFGEVVSKQQIREKLYGRNEGVSGKSTGGLHFAPPKQAGASWLENPSDSPPGVLYARAA